MAHICAVADIAQSVGSVRILRGFAITCPVGNPTLGAEEEKNRRRRYLDKALALLQKPGQRGVVADLG